MGSPNIYKISIILPSVNTLQHNFPNNLVFGQDARGNPEHHPRTFVWGVVFRVAACTLTKGC